MSELVMQPVEMWDIDAVKPYPKNAKLHHDEQVERLARVIKADGWDQPIVVWTDGVIIKGHGRRLAALKLGLKRVPVVVRRDLTQAQADAARISDNAVASLAYDTAVMQEEIRRLMDELPSFDLDNLGLTEKDKTLMAEVLDTAAESAIMLDTDAEISAQKAEDAERVEKADGEMVPLAKVFGFGRMRASDQRVLTGFMAQAEAVTGKIGYDAFVEGLKLAVQRGLA